MPPIAQNKTTPDLSGAKDAPCVEKLDFWLLYNTPGKLSSRGVAEALGLNKQPPKNAIVLTSRYIFAFMKSSTGGYYVTGLEGCNCKGWQFRGKCRHQKALVHSLHKRGIDVPESLLRLYNEVRPKSELQTELDKADQMARMKHAHEQQQINEGRKRYLKQTRHARKDLPIAVGPDGRVTMRQKSLDKIPSGANFNMPEDEDPLSSGLNNRFEPSW